MIHCSSMEGFSSPPSSSLLILRVKGFVIFEELDLRVRLTPMRSFCGDFEVWSSEKKRQGKMRVMGRGQ